MRKVSTKGRYGLRVMVHLAKNYGDGPMLLSDISAKEEVSIKYAEHLIRDLKKTKLLKAYRGSYGGYELITPPEKVKVLPIVEALEGEVNPVNCVKDLKYCKKMDDCPTRVVWQKLEESIVQALDGITLVDLI